MQRMRDSGKRKWASKCGHSAGGSSGAGSQTGCVEEGDGDGDGEVTHHSLLPLLGAVFPFNLPSIDQ